MKDERILVIIYQPTDVEETCQTVLNALQTAVQPGRLTFALPFYSQKKMEDFFQNNKASHFYFDHKAGLASVTEQDVQASYFLLFMGCCAFLQGWDSLLMLEYQQGLPGKLLLTATVWTNSEGEAEVCLPALKQPFDRSGITIGRGLPLVCPKLPVTVLLADPALVFGSMYFLRTVKPGITTLSYYAYQAKYAIRMMTRPYLRPISQLPMRRLNRPVANILGGTTFARFEKSCGIFWEEKTFGYKAAFGLNEVQPVYEQQLCLRQRLSLRLLGARNECMTVTGFVDLPNKRQDPMSYCLCFSFLCHLRNLPLLVFTGGSTEKTVRSLHPNHQNFRERDLPHFDSMSIEEHFRYSKIMMMKRAAESTPSAKYLAWVDFDILPHPLPELAVPDFGPLCDGRIHLATVNGEPDTSFFYVPANLIRMVTMETLSIVESDEVLHRGFSEINLWKRIVARHRDLFALHPMPRKQLLFLSCFDPELLSKQITMYFSKGES